MAWDEGQGAEAIVRGCRVSAVKAKLRHHPNLWMMDIGSLAVPAPFCSLWV